MDVVAVDDDVAEIDPDPEHNALFFRRHCIALGHPTLHRHCAGHRFNDARELDQDAVTGGLDDASLVLGDARIDQFTAMRLEVREGASLIRSHQPAIADDIGGEYGCEPAFHPLFAQRFPPRGAPPEYGPPAIA
jgi:hypothetical protein